MSLFKCAISGLEISVPHFQINLPADKQLHHPIFALTQKQVIYLSRDYVRFSDTEKYLHFLALLHCTECVAFKHPAILTETSLRTVAQYHEKLVELVSKINIIKHPSFRKPRLVVYPDTCQLQTVSGFIYGLETAIYDWHNEYRSVAVSAKIAKRKELLEVWIKDPFKDMNKFSRILADWAALALDFPKHKAARWCDIIISCVSEVKIFSIPTAELDELIEYCECNIEVGTIYSHALLQHLYNGKKTQANFLGFGETTYTVLESGSSVELANKLAIIANAPEREPRQSDYPTKFAFIKAKLAYDMANKVAAEGVATK